MPSSVKARQALRPATLNGTLTTTLRAMAARSCPCLMKSSAVSATASAETGPGTISQISAITCSKDRPVLATRVGLVVTPSKIPRDWASRISPTSAVSIKNFTFSPFLGPKMALKPKKLEELSQQFKISRERVRQIEEKAMEKLQKEISNIV